MKNKDSGKKNNSKILFGKNWLKLKDRIDLLRWSGGFFSALTLFLLLIGMFYIFGYHFPTSPLAVFYTFAAFFSHFGSISFVLWVAVVIVLILFLPYKKFIIPFSVFLASIALCIELLDAQLFSSRHFHLGMLTIRILGWHTWGFGIIYAFIFLMFNSLIAKITWERFVIAHKKIYLWVSVPVLLLLFAFTHAAHVWADATGYIDITRFTTRLPLFYPSTGKHFMVEHGFANISERRNFPKKFDNIGKDLFYPQKPLEFSSDAKHSNVVIIAIDAMRADMVNSQNFGKTLKFAQEHGTIFNNHYSGGNSSKMGLFTFFYGIPPTYQQYAELNKRSPLLIDKMQEVGYNMGIFTSYRLYTPANLDVTVFLKVPNLRLETTIPDPQAPYRNDSAITDQWKSWLQTASQENKPFFGFLFYDALINQNYPKDYAKFEQDSNFTIEQKKFMKYKISLQYIDSLVASVLENLAEYDSLKNTVVIVTSDHGEEFDDNGLGYTGHGTSFSDYQIRTPFITFWPGKPKGTVDYRTSHYDITPTLMKDVFGVKNPESDYCSGKNLFVDQSWNWLVVGSYFNFAILEPEQVTVQFPGGYYEVRGKDYNIIQRPKLSQEISLALSETGRFFTKYQPTK